MQKHLNTHHLCRYPFIDGQSDVVGVCGTPTITPTLTPTKNSISYPFYELHT